MNVAIGFVTGRKTFLNVLKTYINNWSEAGLLDEGDFHLHLFIAYDLKYMNACLEDFTRIPQSLKERVASICFIGPREIEAETRKLKNAEFSEAEIDLLFGEGYARKRNAVIYFSVLHKMDKLLFIDDDEYPLALLRESKSNIFWKGQNVLKTHLRFNDDANITHGHHCGYISPIPLVEYDECLTERDFQIFIEAISNEIISWEKIKFLTDHNGGVTYANNEVIQNERAAEVQMERGMKFISGANLCLNLAKAEALPPFYNPPGARGEDTFMSTGLAELSVLRVPCYTFHDGFGLYGNLLNGVLPTEMRPVKADSEVTLRRFLGAAIGWVRYKPLLIYVTERDLFQAKMNDIRCRLKHVQPKLCAFFHTSEFARVEDQFERYARNAPRHFAEFEATQDSWAKALCLIGDKARCSELENRACNYSQLPVPAPIPHGHRVANGRVIERQEWQVSGSS